jgi:hypothetical protein
MIEKSLKTVAGNKNEKRGRKNSLQTNGMLQEVVFLCEKIPSEKNIFLRDITLTFINLFLLSICVYAPIYELCIITHHCLITNMPGPAVAIPGV